MKLSALVVFSPSVSIVLTIFSRVSLNLTIFDLMMVESVLSFPVEFLS